MIRRAAFKAGQMAAYDQFMWLEMLSRPGLNFNAGESLQHVSVSSVFIR
jgi:hypothetical protein